MTELLYEKKDGIAILTLNRPERKNALTPQMMVRLAEAWRDFRDDDAARVAILTGAGDTFTAGADLARLIPLLTRARQPEDDWTDACSRTRRCSRPRCCAGSSCSSP